MKKLKKLIIWGLIIGISIIILGVAGIMIFFPKEKVKQMAIEKISTALDRKVTIDGISVSLWGGIGAYLEGIKISNPDGFKEAYFVEADALDIKLQFWPLLKKQVMVDRLILIAPAIDLEKLKGGKVNYKFGVIDSLAPENVKKNLPEESKLAVSAISFDNLEIKDGICNYTDDSSKMVISAKGIKLESGLENPQSNVYHASGQIDIDSLLVSSDTLILPTFMIKAPYDIILDQNADKITLNKSEININGMAMSIAAEVPDFSTLDKANISIISDKLNVNDLLSLIPETYKSSLQGIAIDGELALNASVKYNTTSNDTIQYSGNIVFSGIKIAKSDLPGDISLAETSVDFSNDLAKITIGKAVYLGNTFKSTISTRNFENPQIDGNASGNANLASLKDFLPQTGDPKLIGDFNFDLKFKGALESPGKTQLSGKFEIKNASYTASTLPEPVETLNMVARIDNRDIVIDNFELAFPSTDLNLKGKLADAFPYFIPGYEKEAKKPYLTFQLISNKLNIDKLFPEAAPGQGSNLAEIPVDSLPPIILPDIDGNGSGKIDTLIYSGVDFTNIKADIIIEDRKIKVSNANGDVYTGKINGESVIDLNDFEHPRYDGKFSASQIEANDFLSRFTSFGGHLYGKVNLDGSFSAAGLEPEQLLNSLSMNGEALFNEGKLVNFDLINSMAQNFNFNAADEEKIRDFTSKFSVNNGRVEFDNMKFISSFGNWDVAGSIGFDGSLDYKGDVLLTKEMSQKLQSKSGLIGSIAEMLADSETGRINVPFTLGGQYSKPKISLDFKQSEQKVTNDLKEKATDALQNLFKKKKN